MMLIQYGTHKKKELIGFDVYCRSPPLRDDYACLFLFLVVPFLVPGGMEIECLTRYLVRASEGQKFLLKSNESSQDFPFFRQSSNLQ